MKNKKITRKITQGMYILTTNNGGCVVDAVSQISSGDNPLISVSVMKNNYTNELLKNNNKFCLSILGKDIDGEIIKTFGFNSMRDIDKFENIDFTLVDDIKVINDSLGYMICEKVDSIDNDTHTLFIGKLVGCDVFKDEEAMSYQYYQEHKNELSQIKEVVLRLQELGVEKIEFDENFDFKVKINSDENAIVYNEDSDEWIVHFRGNEIDRCNTEADAKRSRVDYLRSMPYPPRKADNKYSSFEGIDYDLEHHLWTAEYNDESLGYFDSEEDAFYALKDHLVKEGVDVSGMHFKEIDELIESDSSANDINDDLEAESSLDNETNEKTFISYYDVFKDKDDSPSDSQLKEEDLESFPDDLNNESNEISSKSIEEYKENSFYGMANKVNDLNISDEVSVYDLESDDEENDLFDDIEMEEVDSDVADRFSKQMNKHLNLSHKSYKDNLFNRNLSHNNKDLKEIRFNSHDENNFRREIILSYNKEELFISLEGMITRDELKEILSKDYFNNTDELNYKKEDDDLFSIYINLQYGLESMDLNCLLDIFSNFAWEFDLLNRLISKDDLKGDLDPLQNLRDDAPMSNCVHADGKFVINHKSIEGLSVNDKFLIISATDGCFGYYPSPMDFETTLYECVKYSKNMDELKLKLSKAFAYVTADDFSYSIAAFGFGSYKELNKTFSHLSDSNVLSYFRQRKNSN